METWNGCESGLVYFQMIPITVSQINEKKIFENRTPGGKKKKMAAIANIKKMELESVSNKARLSLSYLKDNAVDESSFSDKKFCSSYKIVSNDIFRQSIKIKDENWIKELLSGCDFYVEAIKQNNF